MGAAAARVARVRRTLFRPGFYREKNAGLRREKAKSRRQDTHDLSGDTIYAGLTAQNVWIGIKILTPKGARQDNDVLLIIRFLLGEVAPDRGAYTKGGEKVRRDAHDLLLSHGTRIPDGFSSLHVNRKAREGRNIAAPFVVVGERRSVVLYARVRIGVVDRDEPIGVREGQRLQQHGMDHCENCEVRPQANRNRR